MTIDSLSSTKVLNALEEIYIQALKKENFSVALKAKELLGRELGLFSSKNSTPKRYIDDLSDNELVILIKELEAKLKLDHHKSES